jgi:NitT/TauT family transport system substrate-binding protein
VRKRIGVLGVLLAIGLAACGGDADDPASSGAVSESGAQLETLKISLSPITDYAPLYVGMEQGIFEDLGLKIEVTHVLEPSEITATMTSGRADLGTISIASGITAVSNDLPIRLVSLGSTVPTEGYVDMFARKDGDVAGFADLAGKTVATVSLQGLFDLGTRSVVEASGGDGNSVKSVPLAPTDAPSALGAGRVDAIVLQDPFKSVAEKNPEFRSLGNPFADVGYTMPSGGFFSSTETIDEKADALRRFKQGLDKAVSATVADPELAMRVVPTYTSLKAADVEKITLPDYATDVPDESFTKMAEQMAALGWLEQAPAVSDLVWQG